MFFIMVLMMLMVLIMFTGPCWCSLVSCTCCCAVSPPYFYVLYCMVLYRTIQAPFLYSSTICGVPAASQKPPHPHPYLSPLNNKKVLSYCTLQYCCTTLTLKLYLNSFSPISRYSYDIYSPNDLLRTTASLFAHCSAYQVRGSLYT